MSYIPSKPLSVRVVLKHEKRFTPSNKRPGVDAKSGEIGIIEQGTASGQATLVICLETQAGENIYFEVTGNQFEMLMGCYSGAKQRFADRIKMN